MRNHNDEKLLCSKVGLADYPSWLNRFTWERRVGLAEITAGLAVVALQANLAGC